MASTRSRDVIIGIDAGTSLIKAVAFTRGGRQLGEFSLPNTYSTSPGGRVEQDLSRTWNDTVAALRGLTTKVPDLASRAAAVAVTGQGDGTWLVDDDGRPVGPALLWLDSRAAALVQTIRASERNAPLYRRTGSGLNACQQGPQLAWLPFIARTGSTSCSPASAQPTRQRRHSRAATSASVVLTPKRRD